MPTRAKTPTIEDVLLAIFPEGTNGQASDKTPSRSRSRSNDLLATVPRWPPDLFAGMAILMAKSGAYTHPAFFYLASDFISKERTEDWEGLASRISAGRLKEAVRELERLWSVIVACRAGAFVNDEATRGPAPPDWAKSAFELLQIADMACAWSTSKPIPMDDLLRPATEIYASQQQAYAAEHAKRPERVHELEQLEEDYTDVRTILEQSVLKERLLPHVPESLCKWVPPHVACVQLKAMTPQLGQTIRSFSHNLALLPPKGEVRTHWFNTFTQRTPSDGASRSPRGLNLLLVPYPYQIDVRAFKPTEAKANKLMFQVDPTVWLKELSSNVEGQIHGIYSGLDALIESAMREVVHVDGVVLPEMALTHRVAEKVSWLLFEKYPDLHLFVSGVSSKRHEHSAQPNQEPSESRPVNAVYTRVNMHLYNANRKWKGGAQKIAFRRLQIKHHRWRFDPDQIVRYNLSARLAIDKTVKEDRAEWWEDSDIVERECLFWVIKNNYVVSTVICEDLARVEPVQEVLRAVGPNLVIALLLDGPQLQSRWAGRYATGLCDDPGSSVLTLTSLGMLRRGQRMEEGEQRLIGLWRDSFGATKELYLPHGAGGLIFSMSEEAVEERTASNRPQKDDELSHKFVLSGIRPVAPSTASGPMFRFL